MNVSNYLFRIYALPAVGTVLMLVVALGWERQTAVLVAVALAVIVALFLLGLSRARRLQEDLERFFEAMKAVEGGDLRARVRLEGENELGRLAAAFNGMVAGQQTVIEKLSQGALQVKEALEEISVGTQSLVGLARHQASAIEDTSQTSRELTVASGNDAKRAKEAGVKSQIAASSAEAGGSSVRQAADAMSAIEQAAKKITEIVAIISDVAEQTNLLALNAAIEAARAGDQGAGFAVVAGEVRKLAEKAGAATKKIAKQIGETNDRVARGASLASEAAEALKKILENVSEANSLVQEIVNSSALQAEGSAEITLAMDDLSQGTGESARQAEQIASTLERLASQSHMMYDVVTRFRVE